MVTTSLSHVRGQSDALRVGRRPDRRGAGRSAAPRTLRTRVGAECTATAARSPSGSGRVRTMDGRTEVSAVRASGVLRSRRPGLVLTAPLGSRGRSLKSADRNSAPLTSGAPVECWQAGVTTDVLFVNRLVKSGWPLSGFLR